MNNNKNISWLSYSCDKWGDSSKRWGRWRRRRLEMFTLIKKLIHIFWD